MGVEINNVEYLMSIFGYLLSNHETIVEYTINHFTLVSTVILFSLMLWISIGIIISKYEKLATPVMGLSSILFCVPSISFFGIFITIPQLGLGRTSAVLALVIYAMMPLVRNVYRGIRSVDDSLLEAGKGMGMSDWQIMTQIQLPVAWPVIFAGIRITIVMITGIATMATFIGERNLGRLIHHGLTRSNDEMIITGAILVSVISIAIDFLFGLLEKKLTSPGLRQDEY